MCITSCSALSGVQSIVVVSFVALTSCSSADSTEPDAGGAEGGTLDARADVSVVTDGAGTPDGNWPSQGLCVSYPVGTYPPPLAEQLGSGNAAEQNQMMLGTDFLDGQGLLPISDYAIKEWAQPLELKIGNGFSGQTPATYWTATITPPVAKYLMKGGATGYDGELTFPAKSGVTYSVAIGNATTHSGGPNLAGAFHVSTPPAPPCMEAQRALRGFGLASLEHPGGENFKYNDGTDDQFSLGSDANTPVADQIAAVCASNENSVRFGSFPEAYSSGATAATATFKWAEGNTVDALHACGVNVVLVVDMEEPPPWGYVTSQGNRAHDQRPSFETPELYGKYCGGVAAQAAAHAPWITWFEIGTNEPNVTSYGNGSGIQNNSAILDGLPAVDADLTGKGMAAFMHACYTAIKSVDASYQVEGPGYIDFGSGAGGGISDGTAYVTNWFAAGCRVSNQTLAAGTFACTDALSFHDYPTKNPRNGEPLLDRLQSLCAQYGGRCNWANTEIGWATSGRGGDASATALGDSFQKALYWSEYLNMCANDASCMGIVNASLRQHDKAGYYAGIYTVNAAGTVEQPAFSAISQFGILTRLANNIAVNPQPFLAE